MNEIQRTIDWCKGMIKRQETNMKPLPFYGIDKPSYNKAKKRLRHYKLVLTALEEKMEREMQ